MKSVFGTLGKREMISAIISLASWVVKIPILWIYYIIRMEDFKIQEGSCTARFA